MPRQLRTWKEIARHLGVGVRTAQNWERERGLPIRRITGEKSRVHALAEELDVWLAGQDQRPSVSLTVPPPAQSEIATAITAKLANPSLLPSLHIEHLGLCCLLYAGLFVLDLFLEITYQIDKRGHAALVAAPLVAVWIAGSSALGLLTAWRWIVAGRRGAFVLMFIIFATAAIMVFGGLTLTSVLPTTPVTVLRFPSQPAEIAFLKNIVFYFLPLITIVCLVPFHFIACIYRQLRGYGPQAALALLEGQPPTSGSFDALYLPVRWMSFGMFLVGFASVILTQDLLRNLAPSPHANLFMVLAITKSGSYFALGMLCITWYSRLLTGIRGACTSEF